MAMTDWLDSCDDKNARRVIKAGVYKRGFVNLLTWYGDVWARVLSVYIDKKAPRSSSVYFVVYSKYGKDRSVQSARFGVVRAFAKVPPSDARVIYDRTRYSGGTSGIVDWPKPIAENQFSYEYLNS